MYLWNIKELKRQLRSGRITEHSVFSYFLAFLILDTLVIASWGMVPFEHHLSALDYIEAVGYFLIVTAGTIVLYLRNGGKRGSKFLVRYFPLLWVVGIRFLAVCVPITATYVFLTFSPAEDAEMDVWYETAAYLLVTALFYWRLFVHIGDVASTDRARSR